MSRKPPRRQQFRRWRPADLAAIRRAAVVSELRTDAVPLRRLMPVFFEYRFGAELTIRGPRPTGSQ